MSLKGLILIQWNLSISYIVTFGNNSCNVDTISRSLWATLWRKRKGTVKYVSLYTAESGYLMWVHYSPIYHFWSQMSNYQTATSANAANETVGSMSKHLRTLQGTLTFLCKIEMSGIKYMLKTWHKGSRWYTSHLHSYHWHFSIHPNVAPRFVSCHRQVKSSVCSQEVTAWSMLMPAAHHSPTRCFLRGIKEWKSLGAKSRLQGRWSMNSIPATAP